MLYVLLTVSMVVCAIQAVRSVRLLVSALWLIGTSALTSMVLYALGAHQVAVVELSVGAGLVAVLVVYAIAVTGDVVIELPPTISWRLILALVGSAVLLLGWLALPLIGISVAPAESTFSQIFWQQRSPDVLAQIVLLFVGAIGVLGLLADDQSPTAGYRQPKQGEGVDSFAARSPAVVEQDSAAEVQTTREEVEV